MLELVLVLLLGLNGATLRAFRASHFWLGGLGVGSSSQAWHSAVGLRASGTSQESHSVCRRVESRFAKLIHLNPKLKS